MSRRYTPEEKSAALEVLAASGSIAFASRQTGIPERTLHTWRHQQLLAADQQRRHSPLPPPLQFDDDLEALAFMRKQIMQELVNLSADLPDGLGVSSPYQRVLLMSHLLDRLMKLDAHLQPYTISNTVRRIEYVYPDQSVHNVPPWMDETAES